MKKLACIMLGLACATSTMAQVDDGKPSAYNAPVMKKVLSNQFVCKNGETVNARFVDIKTVELTTVQGQSVLTRDHDDTPKWVAVFHRPLEQTRMDTYTNDNSTFKHNATKAVYTYVNADGKKVKTHCEVAQ